MLLRRATLRLLRCCYAMPPLIAAAMPLIYAIIDADATAYYAPRVIAAMRYVYDCYITYATLCRLRHAAAMLRERVVTLKSDAARCAVDTLMPLTSPRYVAAERCINARCRARFTACFAAPRCCDVYIRC